MWTQEMPLFLENIGTVSLYAVTHKGTILLRPGDRKQVCRENAEPGKIDLLDGDLYSAG